MVASRGVACGVARSDTIPTPTRGESRMGLVRVSETLSKRSTPSLSMHASSSLGTSACFCLQSTDVSLTFSSISPIVFSSSTGKVPTWRHARLIFPRRRQIGGDRRLREVLPALTSAAHFSAGGGRLWQLRASLGGDPDKIRKLPPATAAYAIRLMPPRTPPEGERVRTTAAVLLHSRASSSMPPMRFGRTTHQSASSCRVD